MRGRRPGKRKRSCASAKCIRAAGNPTPRATYPLTMLDHLLPRSIDNTYRGHKLAFVPFGLLVLMKCVIGVNSIFNGYAVMTTADGVPLETFPADATQSLLSLWALLGLSHVVIGLLFILVLIRY